jgi:signal transduction histidine kinase
VSRLRQHQDLFVSSGTTTSTAVVGGPAWSEHYFAAACALYRTQILGVGLAVTLAVMVGLPVVIVLWWQHQRQVSAEAEARIAKETFSQTLGIVCHELRNPVHALSATLGMFLEDSKSKLTPGMQYEILTALGSVGTMQAVLDDVLELQRHDFVRAGCVFVCSWTCTQLCCGRRSLWVPPSWCLLT